MSPPEIDYIVQRIIRRYAGGDPYREVKRRSNGEALSIYGECRRIVESSEDPLRTAVKLSIERIWKPWPSSSTRDTST